jgi:hypothetical protein
MRLNGSSHGGGHDDTSGGSGTDYDDLSLPSAYEMGLFIDEIEDLICSGVKVPLTSKAIVDQEQCLDTLQVIRANWPWQM